MAVKALGSVGLVASQATENFYTAAFEWLEFGYFYGVEQTLRSAGILHKRLEGDEITSEKLTEHPLLVLPEVSLLPDHAVETIAHYVEDGGMVLAIGRVGDRADDGGELEDPSTFEWMLGIERRTALSPNYWYWWDGRFALEFANRGREIYRRVGWEPLNVYMNVVPPAFSSDVEVLARVVKDGRAFDAIGFRRHGAGACLTIVPPLGQNIYDYWRDHRYAFFGSSRQTEIPRKFCYPVSDLEDPERGIDFSCARLRQVLLSSVRYLLSMRGPYVEKYPFPNGQDTICLTSHDYDAFGDEQVKVYGYLRDLHDKYGIRSTHYFMADTYSLQSPEIQRIFKELRERGDEIALHGTYEPEGRYESAHVAWETRRLRNASGVDIEGQSLHGEVHFKDNYRTRPGTEISLSVRNAGLKTARNAINYLSPFHGGHGSADCVPHWYPETGADGRVQASETLEIPFVLTDAHMVRMGLSKTVMKKAIRTRFRATLMYEGVFGVIAHPHYQRFPDTSYLDIYEYLIKYVRRWRTSWWRHIDLWHWRRAFDGVCVSEGLWDGFSLSFKIEGPPEVFEQGCLALRIGGWGNRTATAAVDGQSCEVSVRQNALLVFLPCYGHVVIKG